MQDSVSNGKQMTRIPLGMLAAIAESQTTPAAALRGSCHPGSRASRKINASASKPAAISMVRADSRKPGQRDTTATSLLLSAGSQAARELGIERTCSEI